MNLGEFSVHLKTFTDFGAYGVQLFFIISGYLSFNSKINNCWRYYAKRLIRILPLYIFSILYFFITETFIFKAVPVDSTGLYWLRYIFLLAGNFKTDTYFWDNLGITWTIFVFVTYYLTVPIIIKFVKNFNSSVVFLSFTVLLKFVVDRYFGMYLQTLAYFLYFAMGIMIYYAVKEEKTFFTATGLSLLCIVMSILAKTNNGLFYSLLFGVLLLTTMNLNIKNKLLRKIIEYCDNRSYTLYLCHGIIFCGIIDKFSLDIIYKFAIAVFGSILLTVIVYKYYENPVQKFLLNKINRSYEA